MKKGKEEHEALLKKTIRELEAEGWRVVDLEGKSPDAVAAKDGKIIAVEILGQRWIPGTGWKQRWTYKAKKENYSMFDDVVIKVFKRVPPDSYDSRICEYKECQVEQVQVEVIHNLPLTLCQAHSQKFLNDVNVRSRTEVTYWAVDNLKKPSSIKWLRWRDSPNVE